MHELSKNRWMQKWGTRMWWRWWGGRSRWLLKWGCWSRPSGDMNGCPRKHPFKWTISILWWRRPSNINKLRRKIKSSRSCCRTSWKIPKKLGRKRRKPWRCWEISSTPLSRRWIGRPQRGYRIGISEMRIRGREGIVGISTFDIYSFLNEGKYEISEIRLAYISYGLWGVYFVVKIVYLQPLSFLQSCSFSLGYYWHFGGSYHGATSQNEGEGGSTDDGGDGYGHEPSSLEGGVAANSKAEESSNHEAHDGSLDHVVFGSLHFPLEFYPFLGHLTWAFKAHKILLIFLVAEHLLVGVVG